VDSRNEKPRMFTPAAKPDERFEQENNFKASVTREKLTFNGPADFNWQNLNELPYRYKADPTEKTEGLVKQFAGTGK
jgi:hypothetical protein